MHRMPYKLRIIGYLTGHIILIRIYSCVLRIILKPDDVLGLKLLPFLTSLDIE